MTFKKALALTVAAVITATSISTTASAQYYSSSSSYSYQYSSQVMVYTPPAPRTFCTWMEVEVWNSYSRSYNYVEQCVSRY